MQHVVQTPREPFTVAGGRLQVHQVPLWMDNLGWVVVCVQSQACAVVDGPEAGPVLDYVQANGWRLTTVLNTHTHPDHVGINRDLGRRGLLDSMRVYGPSSRPDDVPGITDPVGEGDRVLVGEVQGRVWLTEGHIDGHLTFIFGDENDPDGPAAFCGDTMFGAGCGYLFDGPPAKMHASLQRLATLDPRTRVCCAHEYTLDNLRFAFSLDRDNPALNDRIRATRATVAKGGCTVPSTIAVERATNPFLAANDAADFAAMRSLKDGKAYRAISDEELPS